MAVEPIIPPEWPLVYTLAVGQDWPEADEDALRRLAQYWTDALGQLVQLSGHGDDAAAGVNYSVQAVSSDEFDQYWKKYTDGDQSVLGQLAQQCQILAEQLLQFAEQTEFTKISIDIQVVILLIQVLYDLVIAPLTGGLSMGEAVAAMFFTRTVVREILSKLIEAVILALLPDVITQFVMMADGHRSGFDVGEALQAGQSGLIGGLVGLGAGKVLGGLGKGLENSLGKRIGGLVGAGITGAVTNVATNTALAGVTSIEDQIHASLDPAYAKQLQQQQQQQGGGSGGNLLATIANGMFTGMLFHGVHEISAKPTVTFHGPDGQFTGVKTGENTYTLFHDGLTNPKQGKLAGTGYIDDHGNLVVQPLVGGPTEHPVTGMSLTSHDVTNHYSVGPDGTPELTHYDAPSKGEPLGLTLDGQDWTPPKGSRVTFDANDNPVQVVQTEGTKSAYYTTTADGGFQPSGWVEQPAKGDPSYFDGSGNKISEAEFQQNTDWTAQQVTPAVAPATPATTTATPATAEPVTLDTQAQSQVQSQTQTPTPTPTPTEAPTQIPTQIPTHPLTPESNDINAILNPTSTSLADVSASTMPASVLGDPLNQEPAKVVVGNGGPLDQPAFAQLGDQSFSAADYAATAAAHGMADLAGLLPAHQADPVLLKTLLDKPPSVAGQPSAAVGDPASIALVAVEYGQPGLELLSHGFSADQVSQLAHVFADAPAQRAEAMTVAGLMVRQDVPPAQAIHALERAHVADGLLGAYVNRYGVDLPATDTYLSLTHRLFESGKLLNASGYTHVADDFYGPSRTRGGGLEIQNLGRLLQLREAVHMAETEPNSRVVLEHAPGGTIWDGETVVPGKADILVYRTPGSGEAIQLKAVASKSFDAFSKNLVYAVEQAQGVTGEKPPGHGDTAVAANFTRIAQVDVLHPDSPFYNASKEQILDLLRQDWLRTPLNEVRMRWPKLESPLDTTPWTKADGQPVQVRIVNKLGVHDIAPSDFLEPTDAYAAAHPELFPEGWREQTIPAVEPPSSFTQLGADPTAPKVDPAVAASLRQQFSAVHDLGQAPGMVEFQRDGSQYRISWEARNVTLDNGATVLRVEHFRAEAVDPTGAHSVLTEPEELSKVGPEISALRSAAHAAGFEKIRVSQSAVGDPNGVHGEVMTAEERAFLAKNVSDVHLLHAPGEAELNPGRQAVNRELRAALPSSGTELVGEEHFAKKFRSLLEKIDKADGLDALARSAKGTELTLNDRLRYTVMSENAVNYVDDVEHTLGELGQRGYRLALGTRDQLAEQGWVLEATPDGPQLVLGGARIAVHVDPADPENPVISTSALDGEGHLFKGVVVSDPVLREGLPEALQNRLDRMDPQDALLRGYAKNFWNEGNRYVGLNLTLVHDGRPPVELQFHTADSWRIKEQLTHEAYKIFDAKGPISAAKFDALRQIVDITRGNLPGGLPTRVADFGPVKDSTVPTYLAGEAKANRAAFDQFWGERFPGTRVPEPPTPENFQAFLDGLPPQPESGSKPHGTAHQGPQTPTELGAHDALHGGIPDAVGDPASSHISVQDITLPNGHPAKVFEITSADFPPARAVLEHKPGGAWVFAVDGPKGAALNTAAEHLATLENHVDIVAHATPEGFQIGDHTVPFETVLDQIGALPEDAVVRLISCDAAGDGGRAAQALADHVNRPVVASDSPVFIAPNGEAVASHRTGVDDPYPKRPPDGLWKVYKPGGRADEAEIPPASDARVPRAPRGWDAQHAVYGTRNHVADVLNGAGRVPDQPEMVQLAPDLFHGYSLGDLARLAEIRDPGNPDDHGFLEGYRRDVDRLVDRAIFGTTQVYGPSEPEKTTTYAERAVLDQREERLAGESERGNSDNPVAEIVAILKNQWLMGDDRQPPGAFDRSSLGGIPIDTKQSRLSPQAGHLEVLFNERGPVAGPRRGSYVEILKTLDEFRDIAPPSTPFDDRAFAGAMCDLLRQSTPEDQRAALEAFAKRVDPTFTGMIDANGEPVPDWEDQPGGRLMKFGASLAHLLVHVEVGRNLEAISNLMNLDLAARGEMSLEDAIKDLNIMHWQGAGVRARNAHNVDFAAPSRSVKSAAYHDMLRKNLIRYTVSTIMRLPTDNPDRMAFLANPPDSAVEFLKDHPSYSLRMVSKSFRRVRLDQQTGKLIDAPRKPGP